MPEYAVNIELIILYMDGTLLYHLTDSLEKCRLIGEMLARDDYEVIKWICREMGAE